MEKTDKIYMDSLSTILAGKWDVTKKEAQQFLADFVEIIKEGVDADGLVKIKGLGTFKVIDVDARESVNVNTGQRVLIESHQKLTFTPDALMKELVNKPFSHFETVILNEGVDFSDINEEELENTEIVTEKEVPISENVAEEEPVTAEEEPVVAEEEPVVAEEEPIAAEEESVVADEEPVAIEEEPIITNETPIAAEEEPAVIEEEPLVVEEEPHKTSWWWLWLLLALLACGLSFGAGYWLGIQNNALPVVVEEHVVEDTTSTQEVQTPIDPLIEEETEEPTDTNKLVEEPVVVEVQTPVVEQSQTTGQQSDWQKYDAMDQRIRVGYYGIVGLDREVKAMEGETLAHLSRRILGRDMDCYVEVFNGLKATDVLTGGQKIKIPKLVSKKRLREQNN